MPSEQPVPSWPAPHASAPVDAVVSLPGSKSATNRALVLAALASGPSLLRAPLVSRDTTLMAAALAALGTRVAEGENEWMVMPRGLTGPAAVDVGNAGTVMRFVPPVAALADGPVRFDGDARARERPVGPLLAALRTLGAVIEDDGRGAFPLTIQGSGTLAGGPVALDSSRSSQLVSGLLLAAPRYEKGVEVRHSGPPVPSAPHLAMTVAMLREFGAEVDDETPDVWQVAPGPLTGRELTIEPDLSNAAPFCAAALVTGGRVTIAGWPRASTQPGTELPELLTEMGATCSYDEDGLTVRGGGTIHGIEANLRDAPELTSTFAVLAALADSPSRLTGVAHTRLQETDRLAAMATELNRLGGDVTELEDGLVITPRELTGGRFGTYDDHRLATSAALLGLAVPGVEVENVETTGKTMPGFTGLWNGMLAGRSR